MKMIPTKLTGAVEIQLEPRTDHRGFFMRAYDGDIFASYGLCRNWVQENHSRSEKKGTIRGLHFQFPPYGETKLVRVVRGAILDVFVDLRKASPTFGQWDCIELSEDNFKAVYIPKGFAHGFCTLTDHCDVVYKVDQKFEPAYEGGIAWNDAALGIAWPVSHPILSEKDRLLPPFEQFVLCHNGLIVDPGTETNGSAGKKDAG